MPSIIVLLLIAGLLLLWLEMVVPGMIAGSLGGIALISGITMAYMNHGMEGGNLAVLCTLGGLGLLMYWWSKRFQHTAIGKKMILSNAVQGNGVADELTALVGKAGEAITPLRPSGTVLIEGKRIDAQTDGDWVEIGAPVTVVRAQGALIVVRRTVQEE